MDVLLANASTKVRSQHASLNPPLGLAYIASVLLEHGYNTSAIDFNVTGFSPKILQRILEDEQPRIIGISAHTETYPGGLKIAHLAKQIIPDIVVVIGGTHPTIMYNEAAKEQDIDLVVLGEGEYAMLEIADCFTKGRGSLSTIKGLAYRDNGTIRVTPERPFIQNIDELPLPARDLFPMPLYGTPGQVLISRGGCPFSCRFCAVNNIWKGSRRFRNPENVIREILYIYDNFQLDEISFADDTFTLNREQVIKLCVISQDLMEIFPWRWKCATRVDLVDRELLEKMHQAGCYSITFGVEAGSQKILDTIGKGITPDQVRAAVSTAIDIGIGVVCAFMFPHPDDTEETVREQMHFMKELRDLGATETLAATTPFPGTYYYDNREQLGIKIIADDWDDYDAKHVTISTRNLSIDKLNHLLEELVQHVGLVNEESFPLTNETE